MKVLLIEKDEKFRLSLVKQLKVFNHDVIEASMEAEALRIIGETSIDVVVLGLKDNLRREVSLIEKIKHKKPSLEVIVMVPERHTSLSIEAMNHGAFDDIFIPFDVNELVSKLEKAFSKSKRKAKKKSSWKDKWEKFMVGATYAEAGLQDVAKKIIDEVAQEDRDKAK